MIFSASRWGIAGGLISAAWTTSIMGLILILPRHLSSIGFFTGSLGYFVIGVFIGLNRKIKESLQKAEEYNLSILKENQKLFDHLLEATNDGIWDFNVKAGIAKCNNNFYTMLGYEPGEFDATYENWMKLLHLEDKKRVEHKIKDVLAGNKESYNIEFRARTKDGRYKWLHGMGKVAELDEDKVPWRIVGSQSDIDKRKQKEEMLRSIINAAKTVSLIITDLNSIIKEFSPGAEEIFGYKRDEIIGRHVGPLHEPGEAKKLSNYIERLRKEKDGFTIETSLVRKSGEKFPALFTLQPLFNNEGKLSGTLGVAVDITERKRVEEALQGSEEKLSSILNNMKDVAWSISWPHMEIIYLSPSAEELYGRSIEEFKENPVLWQEITHAEDYYINELVLKDLFEKGVAEREVRIVRPDGSIAWIYDKTKLIRDKENNPIRIEGIATDITEFKEAEKQLQEYTVKLELKNLEVESLYNKLEEEFNKAKSVHEGILPGKLPECKDISIAAYYKPAERMGGDFYNVTRGGNKLIFYLSDVTGHGLEGALMSAFVKEAIDSYISLKPEELTPEKIMSHVFKQYKRDEYPDDYFISLFLGVLDLDSYKLSYTGAGFQEAMLVDKNGVDKLELASQGPPISNIFSYNLMDFNSNSILLNKGSTLMINTDGLTEQMREGKNFSSEMKEVFFRHSSFPPEIIKQVINEQFRLFNGGSLSSDDDITYLIIQHEQKNKLNYKWVLKSNFEELDKLNEEVYPLVSKLLGENKVAFQGLYELVVNALEHGNALDPEKNVTLEIIYTDDYVLAVVEDEGEGFDWYKTVDDLDLSHDKERGRGIMMARLICESLYYNEAGNKAYLVLKTFTNS